MLFNRHLLKFLFTSKATGEPVDMYKYGATSIAVSHSFDDAMKNQYLVVSFSNEGSKNKGLTDEIASHFGLDMSRPFDYYAGPIHSDGVSFNMYYTQQMAPVASAIPQ